MICGLATTWLLWRPNQVEARCDNSFPAPCATMTFKLVARESLECHPGRTRRAPMDSDRLSTAELEDAGPGLPAHARRLTVDGLVGFQTQIAINTDLDTTVERPRLVRRPN